MSLPLPLALDEPLVNKTELARRLGISKPHLSDLIARYPDFPIVEPGTNGKPWRVRFSEAAAFLQAQRDAQAEARAKRDELLDQLVLPMPLPKADPPKGLSIRDQIDAHKLNDLRLKQAREAGQLIPAAQMLATLQGAFADLARDLAAFVRRQAIDHNWSEAITRRELSALATAQRNAVAHAMAPLSGAQPDEPDEPVRRYG